LNMKFRIVDTLQSDTAGCSLAVEMGMRGVFILAGPGIQAPGHDQPMAEALEKRGVTQSLLTRVEPNPTLRNVEEGLARAREFKLFWP